MKIFVALVHLIFATTWLGSAFFYGVVLQPKLNTLPLAEQRALAHSLRATMTPLLAVSALLTIVSGLVMMVQLHSQHPGSFSQSRWGLALIIGALASVGALVIAFIEAAAARREGRPNEDETASKLGRRLRRERSARLVAVALLFVALATMAVARYS
jgi:hypothetical protein